MVLIFVIAQVLAISTKTHNEIAKKQDSKSDSDELIKMMAPKVEAMDREFFPKDGGSMMFHINSLTKNAEESRIARSEARSAVDEAKAAARLAQEAVTRKENYLRGLQESVNDLEVLVASAKEAVKIVQNTIQATDSKIGMMTSGNETAQTQTKTAIPEPLPTILFSPPVGVTSIDQAQKGVNTAQEGVNKTQEGIDNTQEVIDQAKKELK